MVFVHTWSTYDCRVEVSLSVILVGLLVLIEVDWFSLLDGSFRVLCDLFSGSRRVLGKENTYRNKETLAHLLVAGQQGALKHVNVTSAGHFFWHVNRSCDGE